MLILQFLFGRQIVLNLHELIKSVPQDIDLSLIGNSLHISKLKHPLPSVQRIPVTKQIFFYAAWKIA